jgi:hypothetical protein
MTDIIEQLRKLQDEPRWLTHHEIQEIIDEIERLRSTLREASAASPLDRARADMLVRASRRAPGRDTERQRW